MLRITIVNERQRQQFSHSTGKLHMGRIAHGDDACVVIDDIHVSREQLIIEAIEGDKARVECVGRSPVSLPNGTVMDRGDVRDIPIPVRLTMGQTLVEIESGIGNMAGDDDPQTMIAKRSESLKIITNEYIANFYPFPLAFGYRLLRSITNPVELYKEQLRLAENVLAFVGTVSLALLDDQELKHLNEKFGGSALECWRGGISPGHWLDLCIHSADHLEKHDDDDLAQELAGLKINKDKKGFGQIMRELIKSKNNHKHDRGPATESEYRQASDATGEQLRQAYEHLSFFKSYRVFLVQDINPHRRGNQADVVFLKCVGDHPGFTTENKVESVLLRKGDVYIERGPSQLVTLYPFMHATTCPQCKAREFYFIDKLDEEREKDGRRVPSAVLKSFDRGHVGRDKDMGVELTALFASG